MITAINGADKKGQVKGQEDDCKNCPKYPLLMVVFRSLAKMAIPILAIVGSVVGDASVAAPVADGPPTCSNQKMTLQQQYPAVSPLKGAESACDKKLPPPPPSLPPPSLPALSQSSQTSSSPSESPPSPPYLPPSCPSSPDHEKSEINNLKKEVCQLKKEVVERDNEKAVREQKEKSLGKEKAMEKEVLLERKSYLSGKVKDAIAVQDAQVRSETGDAHPANRAPLAEQLVGQLAGELQSAEGALNKIGAKGKGANGSCKPQTLVIVSDKPPKEVYLKSPDGKSIKQRIQYGSDDPNSCSPGMIRPGAPPVEQGQPPAPAPLQDPHPNTK